ncbi:unnamed protein product, partial [Iphiclides podalirius]
MLSIKTSVGYGKFTLYKHLPCIKNIEFDHLKPKTKMQFIRAFFKRITDDLKIKKLIPLKILFFVHASTLFVLYPYLTIQMRELGINVEETAIMSAVTPVISIVMPPLAGMLADKIGNFRLLLALSSALGGASALLLLAVPVGRITITYPPAVQLVTTCGDGAFQLRPVQDYPCTPLHPYAFDVNLTISSCGFVCEIPSETSAKEIESMIHADSYDVRLQSYTNDQRILYRHTVSSYLPKTKVLMKDQSNSRIMADDPFFNTTISKISNHEIFFPTPRLYKMQCTKSEKNATCLFGRKTFLSDLDDGNDVQDVDTAFHVRISHDAHQASTDVKDYWVSAISVVNGTKFDADYEGIDSTTCEDNFLGVESVDSIRVKTGSRLLTKCFSACAALTPRRNLCENLQQQIELDPIFTFWAYMAVRVFIGIIGGTAFAMFEGAVIAIIREQRADYGLQRVYGSIGGMISSPLSGLLIDYASRGKGYTDFRPAFYLYAVLKVVTGALMLSINLEFKQPAQNLLDDVISVFRNVEIVALFIACFIMGTAWGYIESFLFWLLQDLGASRSLMGVTITVGGIAGLPLLVLSGPIIKKLGHANVLFIGFVFYAIRLLGYSLIYNPWLCLIFEALESVTSSLSFTAAVTYAARLSSITTDTSVQGLLGGLYYGVGKGAGSLIGGYLMKFVGTRPTYQIFALATFLTGCVYYLFNKFYIGKRPCIDDENDICKKRPINLDVEGCDASKIQNDKTCPPQDVATKNGTNNVKSPIKTMQKPIQNLLPNSKKSTNLFTNLDNFYDLKNPVRGEAQDVVPMRQPVDRYNPAQPYLPQQNYGGNSKESNKASAPTKATANLVPPPPPPAPKLTDNDFPAPTSYESFPPYPPSVSDSIPPLPAAPKPSVSAYSPPGPPIDDSDSNSFSSDDNTNGPSMDLGYRYKPPSAPVQPFAPTLPPAMKPFGGYNYNKPPMNPEPSPMAPIDDAPDFQGYQYNKPTDLSPPSDQMPPSSYNHHDSPPFHNDNDYPELVFQKHHGDDSKDSDHMKGTDMDMMMPPPSDMKPDHGPPDHDSFPSDFPSDFKYHHDFDDHDFYHHHHTTTTTTTEMPRVNRSI